MAIETEQLLNHGGVVIENQAQPRLPELVGLAGDRLMDAAAQQRSRQRPRVGAGYRRQRDDRILGTWPHEQIGIDGRHMACRPLDQAPRHHPRQHARQLNVSLARRDRAPAFASDDLIRQALQQVGTRALVSTDEQGTASTRGPQPLGTQRGSDASGWRPRMCCLHGNRKRRGVALASRFSRPVIPSSPVR